MAYSEPPLAEHRRVIYSGVVDRQRASVLSWSTNLGPASGTRATGSGEDDVLHPCRRAGSGPCSPITQARASAN